MKEYQETLDKVIASGYVEETLEKHIKAAIDKSIESVFKSYSDVGKTLERKISETALQTIEQYDFSKYITCIERVITENIENNELKAKVDVITRLISGERKYSSSSFRKEFSFGSTITLSQFFQKYQDFISDKFDRQDEPGFIDVYYEYDDETKMLTFGISGDEDMDLSEDDKQECEKVINLSYLKKIETDVEGKTIREIKSFDDFDCFVLELANRRISIDIDLLNSYTVDERVYFNDYD